MTAFAEEMKASQVQWRRSHLSNQVRGSQNNREYDHILPRSDWELNLWPGIASGSTFPSRSTSTTAASAGTQVLTTS